MTATAWWLLVHAGKALVILLALTIWLAKLLIWLIRWVSPRVWRLTERAAVAAYRRWEVRNCAVVVDEQPMPLAITDVPHGHVRWSTLLEETTTR